MFWNIFDFLLGRMIGSVYLKYPKLFIPLTDAKVVFQNIPLTDVKVVLKKSR